MPKFSANSRSKLYTCDEPLICLFEEVIKHFDCTIVSGYRNEDEQNKLYDMGRSQKRFPNSRHNSYPSKAVDVAPYGCWGPDRPSIVWPQRPNPKNFSNMQDLAKAFSVYSKDLAVWYSLAFFIKATAISMKIKIRGGWDWDNDNQINDQKFDDLGHTELD